MKRAASRGSVAANACWALASIGAALALLAAAEGALRLAGIGLPDPARDSRLRYQRIELPILAPARRADGAKVLRPIDARLPFQSILREKPPNGLRVIAFGGSATAGLGFGPNATFGRELERILRAAHPERGVEVLNLGVVGFASRQVARLVAEAARELDADLLVVYSGNNEFLELHAARFADATATALDRLAARIGRLHLARTLRDLVRRSQPEAPLAEQALAGEGIRISAQEMLRHAVLTQAEILRVLDAYEANLEVMVASARGARTPLLLATVGSNWRWRGRDDLPPDWLAARLGEPGPATPERLRRARERLTELLRAAATDARHELLFERAVAAEALGELAAARDDYLAALEADPHRRRALGAANARVREVASRRGTGLLDAVELLAADAPDGIVGFEAFYDHVHFTPHGAALVAAGIYREMLAMGVVAARPGFDPGGFAAARVAELDALRADPFAVGDWLGFGFDPAGIRSRDLWKYARLRRELDRRIAADPRDLAARVYRGNLHYFERDGAAAAASDWRAAAALAPDAAPIRANLARLAGDGR